MIHYHGTPITPRSVLLRLGGRSFCVSHASPNDVKVCHNIGESVMLDNGAFSAWRSGAPVDWDKYYKWCGPWLEYKTTWAVIPDVIDGTEDDNNALIAKWPHGDRGAPVWHLHESRDRLRRLCDEWPRVCFGSSGFFSVVGSDLWHQRIIQAFNTIAPGGSVPVWIHMMRGLNLCGSDYPFSSADSTNVAQNHHRDGLDKIKDIDSRQCPGRWVSPGEQGKLCID